MANNIVSLLQEWRPFTIRDSIKQGLGFISPLNSGAYWMSWRKLICVDSPVLVHLKGHPDSIMILRYFRNLLNSYKRHESGKSFIQPKVIPPLHSDQVSKPHVSQFVKVGVWELKSLRQRRSLSSVQIGFVISNAPYVFHCSIIVFGSKHLIILTKWIILAEQILVVLNATLGNQKHFLVVHILHQTLPGIYSHWWISFNNWLVIIKWTSNNGIKICRNLWCLLECKELWVANGIPVSFDLEEVSHLTKAISNLSVGLLWVLCLRVIWNYCPVFRYYSF